MSEESGPSSEYKFCPKNLDEGVANFNRLTFAAEIDVLTRLQMSPQPEKYAIALSRGSDKQTHITMERRWIVQNLFTGETSPPLDAEQLEAWFQCRSDTAPDPEPSGKAPRKGFPHLRSLVQYLRSLPTSIRRGAAHLRNLPKGRRSRWPRQSDWGFRG